MSNVNVAILASKNNEDRNSVTEAVMEGLKEASTFLHVDDTETGANSYGQLAYGRTTINGLLGSGVTFQVDVVVSPGTDQVIDDVAQSVELREKRVERVKKALAGEVLGDAEAAN